MALLPRAVSALPDRRQRIVLRHVRIDEPGADVYHLGVLVAEEGQSASLGVPGAEGVVLARQLFFFLGCCRSGHALVSRGTHLAFNSLAALFIPSYVLLYGLGSYAVCARSLFRDVMHLWSVVITAWMYLTPIFWTTDFIGQMAHWIQVLVVVNPMYNYLQFMRDFFCSIRCPPRLPLACVLLGLFLLLLLAIPCSIRPSTSSFSTSKECCL